MNKGYRNTKVEFINLFFQRDRQRRSPAVDLEELSNRELRKNKVFIYELARRGCSKKLPFSTDVVGLSSSVLSDTLL